MLNTNEIELNTQGSCDSVARCPATNTKRQNANPFLFNNIRLLGGALAVKRRIVTEQQAQSRDLNYGPPKRNGLLIYTSGESWKRRQQQPFQFTRGLPIVSNKASSESSNPVQDEELGVLSSLAVDRSAGTSYEASASYQCVNIESDNEQVKSSFQQCKEEAIRILASADMKKRIENLQQRTARPSQRSNHNIEEETKLFAGVQQLFNAYVSSHGCVGGKSCQLCGIHCSSNFVKCQTCKRYLCSHCDKSFHSFNLFHERRAFVDKTNQPLSLNQTEFITALGGMILEKIPVPLFSPACPVCQKSEVYVEPEESICAVVTLKGRFNLNGPGFVCHHCSHTFSPKVEDFVASGFWPSSMDSFKFLVATEVWQNLTLNSPETSLRKFIEVLTHVSEAREGQETFIDRAKFALANKARSFVLALVEKQICGVRHDQCKACTTIDGKHMPWMVHFDGNQKLHRLKNAKELTGHSTPWLQSTFGIIPSESMFNGFVAEIERQKKASRNKQNVENNDKCGPSQFLAAKELGKARKHLDETGIVMASCGHGTVLRAVNMNLGETYNHMLYLHIPSHLEGVRYIFSDIACLYRRFLKKHSANIPLFQQLENNVYLSMFHGGAHAWYCGPQFFGHWQQGAANSLGEEQEQVFSHFSLLRKTTYHMTKSNRIDCIISAIVDWNRKKERKIPEIITRRLLTAKFRKDYFTEKLDVLMKEYGVSSTSNLREIEKDLIDQARKAQMNSGRRQNQELDALKEELVAMHYDLTNVENQLLRLAVSSKWRQKLQQKKKKIRKKASEVIQQLNALQTDENKITLALFEKGEFPWSESKVWQRDFNLVNTWMLRERNDEQIALSCKEMAQFVKALDHTIATLQDLNKPKPTNCFDSGSLFLRNREIDRLKLRLATALSYSRYYTEDYSSYESLLNDISDDSSDESSDGDDERDDYDDNDSVNDHYN